MFRMDAVIFGATIFCSKLESTGLSGVLKVIQGEVNTLSEPEAGGLLFLLLLEHPVSEKKPMAIAASKEIFTFLTVCNFKGEHIEL